MIVRKHIETFKFYGYKSAVSSAFSLYYVDLIQIYFTPF